MAEVIGVTAAAAQLGALCFSLLGVLKRIKGGSSALQNYHRQIQDLRGLSDSITHNPLLQTPEVEVYTQALLSIIQDSSLESLLRKSRLVRTLWLLQRERELLDIFAAIERQKTTLSLAIEDIQARALHQIQSDIRTMASTVQPSDTRTQVSDDEASDTASVSSQARQTVPVTCLANRAEIEASEPLVTTVAVVANTRPSQNTRPGQNTNSGDRPQVSYFHRNIAGDGTHQINGIVIEGDSALCESAAAPEATYIYNGCEKHGDGDQIAGFDLRCWNTTKVPQIPAMNGQWNDLKKVAGDPALPKSKGRQILGGRIQVFTTKRKGYGDDDEEDQGKGEEE